MPHSVEDKKRAITRLRRIKGQAEALERAVADGVQCGPMLQQLAAMRGAINGLMEEIIEEHAREHVANPGLSEEERNKGVEELLEAIRRYSK